VVNRTDDIAAVRDVLERVRSGWERMDSEAVLACFDPDPRTVVIGTDAGEYWIGYESFVGAFRAMGGAFSDAEYRWTDGPSVDVAGIVAWSTGRLVGTFTAGDARIELDMRATHVLRRGQGGWRIVQGHYSVAAAEPVAY
jgi:ketosteroid isomerase-like protein